MSNIDLLLKHVNSMLSVSAWAGITKLEVHKIKNNCSTSW